uniref:RNA-directed DNA polymerase n=1 Tax=Strongyloides papillosus TaxID=174720 RepID=A0A0N5CDX8_STREA
MINDFKLNTLTIRMLMICMLIPLGGCQPLGICRFAPSEFPRLYLQNNYDAKKAKQVTLVSVDTKCVALDVFASGYRLGNVFVDPDSNVEHYFDKKALTFSCAGSHLVHLSKRNETFYNKHIYKQNRVNNDIIDKVFSNIPDCYIYLDDILTCSQDEESYIKNIDSILSRIAEYNMKITLNKCQFGQKNAQYLGYIIDFDGIHPNPDKVKAITDKREPKTEKEIKSFLGAVSYFRRHIKNFSALAEPLYRVINSYSWTSEQADAFQALKQALINAAVLAPPDHTAPYTIISYEDFHFLTILTIIHMRNGYI